MDTLKAFDLSTIFNQVPNPVFIKNEDLRFIFVNTAYETMFNVKKENVLGKTVLELDYLSERDRDFYQNEDLAMLRSEKTRHHIFNYLYKGREMHTCLYWSSGFAQKDGTRGLIGVIVDINRQSKKIQELEKRLRNIAVEKEEAARQNKIDALTLLYNRRALDEILETLATSGNGFACIMLDMDHFKLINDTFGHAAGDAVLKALGAVLQRCCRGRDVVCRYGGEEFVVLLPGHTTDQAVTAAERIRRAVQTEVRRPDGEGVTISAGCSAHVAGEAGEAAVQRADKALYMAKESGRNRVCALEYIP